MKKLNLLLSGILSLTMLAAPAISTNAKTLNPITPISSNTKTNNKIYERHYTLDLRDLDFDIQDNNVSIKSKKTINSASSLYKISAGLNNDTDFFLDTKSKKNKLSEMLNNSKFKYDFINMVKDNDTPLAIGVAKTEVLITCDKDGHEISSRPLTEDEVKEVNLKTNLYSATGQTQKRETLEVYTYVKGTSPNYWVQVNAYWRSNYGEMSAGYEAAGITWDSSFSANNSSTTTAVYGWENKVGSPQDFKAHAGISWAFPSGVDKGPVKDGLKGFYGGIGVKRTGGYGYHNFTGEYIHTYSNLSWTAQVSYNSASLTQATISLTNSNSSWKLVSWVSGNF